MTKLKKRFSKINIEISNICNLQCSFCPEVIREKKMMSLEMFENLIQQAAPLTELVCLHLMGDPLVHPKLNLFLDICDKYGVKVFFVTNGVLLNADRFSMLLKPCLYQVNFSLHSFFDNYPEKNPDIYLNKIFQWTELAFKERPDLYINYRLWNLQDTRADNSKNKYMLKKIEDHFNKQLDLQIDVKKSKSYQIKNKLYLHFDTEFIWPDLNLPVLGQKGTCYGLSSHFGVHADGTVVACCLDKEAKIPLGHIEKNTLIEIIDSPKARSIRDGFKKNQLLDPLCQRCQYIERFQ